MRIGKMSKNRTDPMTPKRPQNRYYEAISVRLGVVQVILYVTLFAFVFVSVLANTEMITYRNFYYFFKDLNASFETIDVFQSDSVSYSTSEEQSFVVYRNGLAVAGNNAVTLFTETGRQTLSQTVNYKNPQAVGTGKYLLVYELGGTSYSLYNSYTCLYRGQTEKAIRNAVVSDSGMYAIVSSTEEYTSSVSLYDSNFSLINRYNKNGYVMDVSIDDKGNQIAILSSAAQGGAYVTELFLHRPGSDAEGVTVAIGNALGLSCIHTETGSVGVLCTDQVAYINDGTVTHTYRFQGKQIVASDLGKSGVSVALKDSEVSQKNQIIVFDKSGKVLYNETVAQSVQQLVRYDTVLFWMHTDGIVCLNTENGQTTTHSYVTEDRVLLARGKNQILLCSPQKTEFISFTISP